MATIKETGRLAYKGEVESGMAKSGNAWYRQTIVVDVAGYKGSFRKVALQASGNMVGEIEKVQFSTDGKTMGQTFNLLHEGTISKPEITKEMSQMSDETLQLAFMIINTVKALL